ncbi:MAG: hypothetical protein HY910_16145 [Desulfarculus sp.]|nr:hypothetical protein [Desulfarculus sp.]
MSQLQRLGGEACAYFQRGRCTRTQGPEASAEAKCAMLEARRKVGAQTLDRLERLKRLADPDDREVARRVVIQKNITAINRITCPGFVPARGDGPLCVHQHLVYCLLLLPQCQGRCEHYWRRRQETGTSRGRS